METLTSARNPALKEIRKAIVRGSTTDQGYCVAEGLHLLDEALKSGCEIASVFANGAGMALMQSRLGSLDRARIAVLSDEIFASISTTEVSQGIISVVKPRYWTLEQLFDRRSPLLILDGVQDPGNAGTMIRAAEAFAATGIALLRGSVNPYNPKALRASAGSIYRVPVVAGLEAHAVRAAIEERGFRLFATVPGDLLPFIPLEECHLDRECAVVIGSEAHGVSQEMLAGAQYMRISTTGVESLNAAMAATVVLYEAQRQRRTGES